jgi:DNA-binding transcriptional LysR family regulator
VGEGFIGEPLSSLLIRFQAKFPGLLINVHAAASSNEVARLVAQDDAHLGLVLQPSDDPRIRVLASVRQPLCAIMQVRHPLAQARSLKLADLQAYRLCLLESSSRTRQLLKAAEHSEGLSLQPALTSNSITLLKNLLQAGDFFTLLPRLAASAEIDGGAFAAVPIASSALQDVAVQLVSRVGRRLPPAPLRMLTVLMSYLEACAGLSATAAPADTADTTFAAMAGMAASRTI